MRPQAMLLLATVSIAMGCGSAALPINQLAAPREGIRAAEELGAEHNPDASLYLKYARDQVAEANRLLEEGDTYDAQLALLRANADARLALEITRAGKAREEADKTEDEISALIEETSAPR